MKNRVAPSFISDNSGISKRHWPALIYVVIFIVVALLAPVLPLGFSPNAINLNQVYQPPFQWHLLKTHEPFHWLGTDRLGRDLLANLVFGARTALFISLPAMVMATLLGSFMGSVAGYFRDISFKISIATTLLLLPTALALYFYSFYVDWSFWVPSLPGKILIKIGLAGVIFLLSWLLTRILKKIPGLAKTINFPLDFLVLRAIEVTQTLPRLLLILSLAAFLPPAFSTVIFLLIFTYWPSIARIVRAEIIKQKSLTYLEAAATLGFSHRRILFRHALPNTLTPVLVSFAFGMSNLMVLESTLSFLGIGIPADTPSWGRAISGIQMGGAWWLAFFPGLVLCLTVISIQVFTDFIIKAINPKHA